MNLEKIPNKARRSAFAHSALILSKKIGVGSAKANDDLRQMILAAGSIENLYADFFSMLPVDLEIAEKIVSKLNRYEPEFHAFVFSDEAYPTSLQEHPGTPPILYVRGDLSLLKASDAIGFVGTRELNRAADINHGKRVIKRLIDSGLKTIVSGLALGSDTLGHKTAIECGGRTIAVLGTPLDMSYPKENAHLQERIALENLLVSEYPIGIGSFGSFFANRNRSTVSLSTNGIVVARAGNKSGTQHAIRICAEQRKPIYVLENNLREPEYTWIMKYKDSIKLVREDFDASDNL